MSVEFLLLLLQAAGALLAVLGLAWLLARGVRQSGMAAAATAEARLEVKARLPLDAKRRLLLLRVDGQEVVLLVGPHGETLLGWLPTP
jgi:flagellar protein FliO/FliZ